MSALLLGCGTTTVTQYIAPSDALLTACIITPPPSKEAYINASAKDREVLLAEAWSQQTSNLVACDERIGDIRRWKEEMLK